MTPRLSILMATVPERAEVFARLDGELKAQAKGLPVEFIVDDRPRGPITVGTKRNDMVKAAKGDYVVHIDDDDWVSPEYVQTILNATATAPDCIGHYELVDGLDKVPHVSIWSNRVPRWMEGARSRQMFGTHYARYTFHKTPIRREHALATGFKDMRFAEDHDFSQRLQALRLCRTEVFIPHVLYFYRYKLEDHATKFGTP